MVGNLTLTATKTNISLATILSNINNTGSLSDGGIKLNYTGYYTTAIYIQCNVNNSITKTILGLKVGTSGCYERCVYFNSDWIGCVYTFNKCIYLASNTVLYLYLQPSYKLTNTKIAFMITKL